MKVYKHEHEFTRSIVKSLNEWQKSNLPVWAYHLPDFHMSGKGNVDLPFDITCCINNHYIGIEGKIMTEGYEPFSESKMRESQMHHLSRLANARGHAYVFLNICGYDEIFEYDKLLIFEWSGLLTRWLKGSVKVDELKEHPSIAGTKGYYDLSDFIERFL